MTTADQPTIDCHVHVIDPARFPYGADIAYKPSGQEIGTAAQLEAVMQAHGVRHALLVQPNSGYGGDNACMLDAIARGAGRFKGVAIIPFDATAAMLADMKERGIVGAAFNPTFHGVDYYRDARPLVEKLADAGMYLQLQIEHDQLVAFAPLIEAIPVKVLIDHCGRPTAEAGLHQAGFQTLLKLADTGRVHVKLSGYAKFARAPYPFDDVLPYVRALTRAFGFDRCLWASDWPFLRSAARQDYGPLLALTERLFPDARERRMLLWDTPRRLFGFGD